MRAVTRQNEDLREARNQESFLYQMLEDLAHAMPSSGLTAGGCTGLLSSRSAQNGVRHRQQSLSHLTHQLDRTNTA